MLYFEKWQQLQACYTGQKNNKQNKTKQTKPKNTFKIKVPKKVRSNQKK